MPRAKSQEPRAKSYNYSLKFLSLIVHIIICGILALNFLYFVAFYNTGAVSIPDPDGATDVRPEPGAIYATAQEGFTFGWTNNEGYYNLYDYTRGMSIDVLMMGASHMTGSHLFTKDTASFMLNRLSGLAVYNIGASAHYFLTCANNIQAAAEKYHPGKYIVIETGEVIAIAKKRTATVVLVFVTFSTFNCQLSKASDLLYHSEAGHIIELSQLSKDELHAIAKTLAGECYDDKELDKRRVCEVILNRVSNSKFANLILEVLTTSGAFNGYWKQSRPVSKNDYLVAEQALKDWYGGGCAPLSEWLFFCKGRKRENVFRSDF